MNAKNLIILLVLIILVLSFLLYKCIDKLPKPTKSPERTETSVDCGDGESLVKALAESRGDETFFVSGECRESSTVAITQKRVTVIGAKINGQGRTSPAVLIGKGAEDTILADVMVSGAKGFGVQVANDSKRTVFFNLTSKDNGNKDNGNGLLVGELPIVNIRQMKDYYPTKQKPAEEKQPLSYCYPSSCGSGGGDSRVADTAHTIKFSLLREAHAATCTMRDPTGTLEISQATGHVGDTLIMCGRINVNGFSVNNTNDVSTVPGTMFTSNNSSSGVGISVAGGSTVTYMGADVTATGNFYNAFVAQGSKLICSGSTVNIPPNRLPPDWGPPEVNNCEP